MTPTVTMIVATHNRPAMLKVALLSLLATAAMAEEDVQVIVVDDASETMAARDIAKALGVDYLRNRTNLGVGATLARGYDLTDSEFSMFWGDDAYPLPRFLPLHLAKIREGFDAVSGSYWMTDANLRPVREVILRPVTFRDLMAGRCSAVDVSLMRRSALPPWRPERERAMLMTMWLALTNAGKRLTTIAEPTWLYRRHEAQLSHRPPQGHDMALRLAAIAEYKVPA